MGILEKKWDFMEPNKTKGKIDVRVVFDIKTSNIIRKDIEIQHRTIIEQIKYIVDQYYNHQE
jgi:hypothetical protein